MVSTPFELDSQYEFRHEFSPDFLYVHVTGAKNTYAVMRSYASRIADLCKTAAVRRILVEIDFPPAASVHDVFDIINELDELGLSKKIFAVVDPRSGAHHDINKFAEMVAANRRMKIFVFDTRDEAEQWLVTQFD